MFRGALALASVRVAQSDCDGCSFDVTALEEFSIDFEAKVAVFPEFFQTQDLGRERDQDQFVRIRIGFSENRPAYGASPNCDTKCVTAPVPVHCATNAGNQGIRVNSDNRYAPDSFVVTADGTQVCAYRPNNVQPGGACRGWGQNLEIACVPAQAAQATSVVFTTGDLPDNLPSERGSLALHARNLQLKLDNHLSFPTQMPHVPHNEEMDQDLQQLSGMQIHEQLHINGAAGVASLHVDSPIMNLCFQLDHLPTVIAQQLQQEQRHDVISQQLQQAEQMVPALLQQHGVRATVDGEDVVGWKSGGNSNHMTADHWRGRDAILFDNSTSHPALVLLGAATPRRPDDVSLALKFSNYNNSVGNQFAVRACEIEDQIATQSFLATNPETRTFIASRIAAHQNRLQALLQPQMLNPRFNFIPLEIAGLMVHAESSCATELAQNPQSGSSTFKIAVCAAFSLVMGIVTTRFLGKNSVTPADEYLLSA